MISADTIKLLTGHKKARFDYVLGCRMGKQKEVSADVLSRAGRYQKVADNLEVKEVRVGKQRYVVCRNPIEAAKDQAARETILAKLRERLSEKGSKTIIGSRG